MLRHPLFFKILSPSFWPPALNTCKSNIDYSTLLRQNQPCVCAASCCKTCSRKLSMREPAINLFAFAHRLYSGRIKRAIKGVSVSFFSTDLARNAFIGMTSVKTFTNICCFQAGFAQWQCVFLKSNLVLWRAVQAWASESLFLGGG